MNPDQEAQDAERVDEALAAIAAGNHAAAERMLREVIARTPAGYGNESEDREGQRTIKFWDVQDYVHYLAWAEERGGVRTVTWVKNAYPRAYYALGFLAVKTGRPREAIEFLRQGEELEPAHPRFKLELGQALIRAGEHAAALAEFEQVRELGPFVGARDLAAARRGKGFALIELGRLDEAEAAFRASLELAPDNEIATGELAYIARLRQKSRTAPAEATQIIDKCLVCERRQVPGKEVLYRGRLRKVCLNCEPALADSSDEPESTAAKPWWQFWQ